MNKYVDFNTLYGKLGNYPGDFGLRAAEALFRLAMKQPKESIFAEYGPDGARAMVILGTAAKNLGGKLYVVSAWESRHPQSRFWFERAVKLFGLTSTVIMESPAGASFVLLWPHSGEAVFPDCKAIFALGVQEMGPGWRLVEQGEGYIYAEAGGGN